ncbi:Arylsulfatase [Sedimentisphaera cyanobacteriorum]|uniref:Arylsulfatase n=1 Tax=Sedimentisphaera cyanobacteriorum TaxID=1940790 RepID=A0A1Q2HP82_9BACT|nr:arylsulfatase [Sedimentisphaera cyanobacteriorum]AQQ09141.1 Arylsulfatase [Sedimentisphaera cyanobacteriorum]
MNRRKFLQKAGFAAAAAPFAGYINSFGANSANISGADQAVKRPNILLVLFDDLGYSDLGCYGGEVPTPNIDKLADGGLRYTHMTNSARCCPSRASLLTGLHPGQTGIPNFGGSLVDSCVTLGEALGKNGYQTYHVGKWHVGAKEGTRPTDRGFDEFYGYYRGYAQDQWEPDRYHRLPEGRKPEITYDKENFYATDAFNDYTLEFLDQAKKKDKPWFMYLAHSSPHFPVQAPYESVKPLLDTYRKGWDKLRKKRFERQKDVGLFNHEGWKLTDRSLVPVENNNKIANGYSGEPNPSWDSLPEDRREDLAHRMAVYAAMVKHVDDGIGKIVEKLKAQGEYENTVIMILSDNGACYEWGPFGFDGRSRAGITKLHKGEELKKMGGPGTHHAYGSAWANMCNTPFRLYKHFTHQGGIVTPFIVHWPAGLNSTDRWVRDYTHIIDVMPTLLDVAKAKYPRVYNGSRIQPMEGVSLTKTFEPGGKLEPRTLCYNHQKARAIIKGKWKMVWGKRFPEPIEWELYDIEKDPCETEDVADKHPELVKTLSNEWQRWKVRTKAQSRGNK